VDHSTVFKYMGVYKIPGREKVFRPVFVLGKVRLFEGSSEKLRKCARQLGQDVLQRSRG
jgi:hypothetical protein